MNPIYNGLDLDYDAVIKSEYGDEYKRNCLIFDDIPDEIRKAYNPFDSCASAQILIKKEQKEVIR